MKCILPILLFTQLCAVGQAMAGHGAYMRIYNLTDNTVRCEAEARGFGDDGPADGLNTDIPSKTAFPGRGTKYIEESSWSWNTDLQLKFRNQKTGSEARVKISYGGMHGGFYRSGGDDGSSLFCYTSIRQNNANQDLIAVFVAEQNVSGRNWMSALKDTVPLQNLLIPGTHDTAAYSTLPIAQTQNLNLKQQLDLGIRYFDIRGEPSTRHGKEDFITEHTVSLHDHVSEVFEQTISFLKDNPSETVMIQLSLKGDDKYKERVINRLVAENPDYYHTRNSIPKLRDARKKIVLLHRESLSKGFKLGSFPDNKTDNNVSGRYAVQDLYAPKEDHANRKQNAIISFFEGPASKIDSLLKLNFVSFTGGMRGPMAWADQEGNGMNTNGGGGMNRRIYSYLLNYNDQNTPSQVPDFHTVMLMDAVYNGDGLVKASYLFNLAFHDRPGDVVTNGGQFRLSMPNYPGAYVEIGKTPKFNPKGEECYMGQLIDKNQDPGRQIFTFTHVKGNSYHITTLGPDGDPVYLTDRNQSAFAVPKGSATPPTWDVFYTTTGNGGFIIRSSSLSNFLSLPNYDGSSRPRLRTGPGLHVWQLDQVDP